MKHLTHPAVLLPALVLAAYLPFAGLHLTALYRGVLGASLLAPALGITAVGPLLALWEWDFVLGFSRMVHMGTGLGTAALVTSGLLVALTLALAAWPGRRTAWPRVVGWLAAWMVWFALGLQMWLAVWTMHTV